MHHVLVCILLYQTILCDKRNTQNNFISQLHKKGRFHLGYVSDVKFEVILMVNARNFNACIGTVIYMTLNITWLSIS